jgi:uncharacterized protein
MKADITEAMIEHIYQDLDDDDQLTLTFQGGEPTYAGLPYFRHLITCVQAQTKKVEVHYAIQTNGTLITPEWAVFLKENHFLVGLSIDGTPSEHDLNRLDTHNRGTYQRVLKTKHLLDEVGVDYNILCVLTQDLSEKADQVFRWIKEEKVKYIQFIPCLDDLDLDLNKPKKDPSSYALTPQSFAHFYQRIQPLWFKELQEGHYISIKLFDDIINLLVNGKRTACGILGNCQIQYVIEADGSVYPCDFYVLDDYRMGYIQNETLRQLFVKSISRQFLNSHQSLAAKCASCDFLQICRGGCKRMKDAMYVDELENFCGYEQVLRQFIPKIEESLALVQRIGSVG